MLVAAAGNAGAKSPPLYPAADPNVIAVSATDADDKLFEQSNRGRYITVAAPGAQILVAIPDNGYEMSSGTSYSAAEVSGIVALMLQRKPDLTPDKVQGHSARDRQGSRTEGPRRDVRRRPCRRLWRNHGRCCARGCRRPAAALSASAPARAERNSRHEQYISCARRRPWQSCLGRPKSPLVVFRPPSPDM